MSELKHDTKIELRVGVLENKFDTFTHAMTKQIGDLAHATSKQISDLTTAVQQLYSRPSNIAWREIAMTAGTFLGLFYYVNTYIENKIEERTKLLSYRMQQLEFVITRLNQSK